jgi:hypothetical protein
VERLLEQQVLMEPRPLLHYIRKITYLILYYLRMAATLGAVAEQEQLELPEPVLL